MGGSMTMSNIAGTITIRLEGQPTEDGRMYITSPDLRGFHFIVEHGEDPVGAMSPTLMEFMGQYLNAKITGFQPSMAPRDYRARQHDVPRQDHGIPGFLNAAVA